MCSKYIEGLEASKLDSPQDLKEQLL